MTLDQIAADHYRAALAFDQELRDSNSRYARIGSIDDERVAALRFTATPKMPALLAEETEPAPAVSFSDIIDAEARVRSRGKDTEPLLPATEAKFRRHTKEFSAHRGTDNAVTTTEAEVRAWMAALQEAGQRSNRTITDMLSSVRTVLSWGHQRFPNTLPALSVVKNVKAPKATKRESWTKTFTMAEAEKILSATRNETRPALRWVP